MIREMMSKWGPETILRRSNMIMRVFLVTVLFVALLVTVTIKNEVRRNHEIVMMMVEKNTANNAYGHGDSLLDYFNEGQSETERSKNINDNDTTPNLWLWQKVNVNANTACSNIRDKNESQCIDDDEVFVLSAFHDENYG
jgi:hypothetical protein